MRLQGQLQNGMDMRPLSQCIAWTLEAMDFGS